MKLTDIVLPVAKDKINGLKPFITLKKILHI